jgi:hypothetical protein
VSTVAVVEEFALHAKAFADLLHRALGEGGSTRERLERALLVAPCVRAEHPEIDPDLRVPRLRVYENPTADAPLPRDVFSGPHDQRWGLTEDGWYGRISGPDQA